MRRSIATVSLSGTLESKLRAAARAGFDGVEIFENDLLACPDPPREVGRSAEDLGLTIDLYQPFRDFEAVPDDVLRDNLRRAEAKFDVMQQLGATTVLVCSNVSPAAIDDDDLAAEQLHELAERAAARNLRVAYEALAWGRHVDDYRHAYRIVEAADHPHLGVCLDSFHVLSRGHDPQAIRDMSAEKIFYLQLADAPQLGMDVLQWSRHYRCFPGQGGFDLPAFVEHVVRAGYHGPLSLEIFNDVFRQADASRTAIDAMRSLLQLEEAVANRLAEHDDGVHVRERLELFSPPAVAELEGFDFVELGVTPDGLAAVTPVLEGLGFVPAGQHRTKSVSLWTHGDVDVLVNEEVAPSPSSTTVWIAALGLATEDPRRMGNRAEALRVPSVVRRRGSGEAELPTAVAPGGVTILFVGSGADDERAWRLDFDQHQPQLEHDLLAIDHVALSLPLEQFDEGALFFRSVVGLEPETAVDLADTHGLVRSQALSTPSGTTRVALNVPLLGTAQLRDGETHELQHAAFACSDIFATAEKLHARGLQTLQISDNYYDDLAARWDLDASTLRGLREHGILYDQTSEGAFFHLFTLPVGRVFFEVVQRIEGYYGYGAPNAPIRLAAMRATA